MFVLDEADEMLSRGFKDQIYDIFQKLNSNTQVSKPLETGVVEWGGGGIGQRWQVPEKPQEFRVSCFGPLYMPASV